MYAAPLVRILLKTYSSWLRELRGFPLRKISFVEDFLILLMGVTIIAFKW